MLENTSLLKDLSRVNTQLSQVTNKSKTDIAVQSLSEGDIKNKIENLQDLLTSEQSEGLKHDMLSRIG